MFVRPRKEQRRTTSSHESDGARRSHRKHREPDYSTEEFDEPRPLRRHNSEPVPAPPERKDSAIAIKSVREEVIQEEVRDIVVRPEDLQATFENLMCVIKEKGDVVFSGATVRNMLESVYEWMVFDKNLQIIIPSEPGSSTVQKMWPHGSRIDTRRKKDRSIVESSSRRLKEVEGDYASTVASSVISSTLEEDGMKIRKGSIMYPERMSSTPMAYSQPIQYQQQEYSRPIPMHPAPYPGREYDSFSTGPPMHRATAQTFAPVPPPARNTSRYSMVGGVVEPPQRVQETPQLEPAQPSRRKVRKPKVGASSRPVNAEDDGTDVQFAD